MAEIMSVLFFHTMRYKGGYVSIQLLVFRFCRETLVKYARLPYVTMHNLLKCRSECFFRVHSSFFFFMLQFYGSPNLIQMKMKIWPALAYSQLLVEK